MAPGPRADGDPARESIVAFLQLNQGAHLSAVVRALRLGNHQAAIHLKTLQGLGSIWGRREGRFQRYYTASIPPHTPVDELPNPQLAFTPDTMQFQIIDRLARNPPGTTSTGPLTQGQLAEQLGCSQQLVSHHLISLEESGCVNSRRAGFRKHWRVLAPGLQAITGGSQSLSTLDNHDLDALMQHYSQQ
jgi:predicted ArsR family transcriptional regulator